MSQWAVEPGPGGELLLDGIRLSTLAARVRSTAAQPQRQDRLQEALDRVARAASCAMMQSSGSR